MNTLNIKPETNVKLRYLVELNRRRIYHHSKKAEFLSWVFCSKRREAVWLDNVVALLIILAQCVVLTKDEHVCSPAPALPVAVSVAEFP